MRKLARHVLVAAALVGLGWVTGLAQGSQSPTGLGQGSRGDFEIRVQSPTGKTTVECVRGCKVIGARDIGNPRAGQMASYWFTCNAPDGCQGQVVGFVEAGR